MALKNTKSTGYDGISTQIIKRVVYIIAPIITHIINQCLEEGIFPTYLKTTVVTPLFKKGDPEDVRCYRPIALIPIFAKIFEKVLNNKLTEYFEKNKIIIDNQVGFRKGKSVNSAIHQFLEKILTELDKKNQVTALYMDMTKAFDYVDHELLLQKLEIYGVRGKALQIIKSYLCNRIQFTEITQLCPFTKREIKYTSSPRFIKYGVPQGSILGPLLFLIYINDLPNAIQQPMVLFADDSTVLFTNNKNKNHEQEINDSLSKLINWLQINNLQINLTKTHYMNFKNKNATSIPLSIAYNNETVAEVANTKFLGIHIDSNMSWKTHVNSVCTKLNQFSYALYMLKKVSNQTALLTAYHAYVGSTLSYGLLYWGNSTDKEIAFKAQKKCIRSICGLRQTDSCKPHFVNLKILTLPALFIYLASILVKSNITSYDTLKSRRLKHTLRDKTSHTRAYSNSVFCMSTKIYNKLPMDIKIINSIIIFKRMLKIFLIKKAYYSIAEFLEEK